jgi:hypothetical protein
MLLLPTWGALILARGGAGTWRIRSSSGSTVPVIGNRACSPRRRPSQPRPPRPSPWAPHTGRRPAADRRPGAPTLRRCQRQHGTIPPPAPRLLLIEGGAAHLRRRRAWQPGAGRRRSDDTAVLGERLGQQPVGQRGRATSTRVATPSRSISGTAAQRRRRSDRPGRDAQRRPTGPHQRSSRRSRRAGSAPIRLGPRPHADRRGRRVARWR